MIVMCIEVCKHWLNSQDILVCNTSFVRYVDMQECLILDGYMNVIISYKEAKKAIRNWVQFTDYCLGYCQNKTKEKKERNKQTNMIFMYFISKWPHEQPNFFLKSYATVLLFMCK